MRPGALLGGDVSSSNSAIELTAAVAFTHGGVETKLVLPGLAQSNHSARCDPALIKAIPRGCVWFEEPPLGMASSFG